ncbi:MAG: DUF4870 domain-containing protein [bacterium]
MILKKKPDREQTWAMVCHLITFTMFIGIPFGNIIGPLIVWLIKRDEYPLVNDQGKESLNFQISITIYMFIAGILCFIFIGFLILPALVIADIVFVIIATIKVNEGEYFRYPMTIRLIK